MNTIPALVQIMAWCLQGADKKKTQSSALLAIMRGMDQWPVNSLHKGPVTRKKVSIWWRHHDDYPHQLWEYMYYITNKMY